MARLSQCARIRLRLDGEKRGDSGRVTGVEAEEECSGAGWVERLDVASEGLIKYFISVVL